MRLFLWLSNIFSIIEIKVDLPLQILMLQTIKEIQALKLLTNVETENWLSSWLMHQKNSTKNPKSNLRQIRVNLLLEVGNPFIGQVVLIFLIIDHMLFILTTIKMIKNQWIFLRIFIPWQDLPILATWLIRQIWSLNSTWYLAPLKTQSTFSWPR